MRPHAELAVGLGIFGILAAGAAALGSREHRQPDFDPRRSTFLTGPDGARGYAEALERLRVRVERFRRRPMELRRVGDVNTTTVLAVVGPTEAIDPLEAAAIAAFGTRHDLLLAGEGAEAAMRCYGYTVEPRLHPMLALVPGQRMATSDMRVWAVLARAQPRPRRAPVAWDDEGYAVCDTPSTLRADTLLRTIGGRVVALRLEISGGRAVTLVADDLLFSNRALRSSSAGPFALRLVAGRYGRIVFDEYHQGYGPSGSLAGALLDWSTRSPWGWAGWQLAAVALLGLAAAGVRFGPVRPSPERRRRSSLEHVRALATVLSAARGHDLAVRLMLQGLRRRLSRHPHAAEAGLRADPRPWSSDLARRARSARARAALESLCALTERPQSGEGVLHAANAVEDVWEDLKP
jgi:Domain of unknown function (DUF4350)